MAILVRSRVAVSQTKNGSLDESQTADQGYNPDRQLASRGFFYFNFGIYLERT